MANVWRAKLWTSGTQTQDWNTLGSAKNLWLLGWAGSAYNRILEIEFTCNDGNYETIALYWYNNYNAYLSSSTAGRTFRYKIVEKEDSSYNNATASSPYDGTITLAAAKWNGTTVTFTRSSGFIKGKTYYIYIFSQDHSTSDNCAGILWGTDSANGVKSYEKLDSFVAFSGGMINIYVDGGWKSATPYVYVDGEWKAAIPYVYSGGWQICT